MWALSNTPPERTASKRYPIEHQHCSRFVSCRRRNEGRRNHLLRTLNTANFSVLFLDRALVLPGVLLPVAIDQDDTNGGSFSPGTPAFLRSGHLLEKDTSSTVHCWRSTMCVCAIVWRSYYEPTVASRVFGPQLHHLPSLPFVLRGHPCTSPAPPSHPPHTPPSIPFHNMGAIGISSLAHKKSKMTFLLAFDATEAF